MWKERELDKITIAPDPIDNEYEGEGQVVFMDNRKSAGSVLVNDEYAYNNNVVIIQPINHHIIPLDDAPADTLPDYFVPKTWDEFNLDNYGYRFTIEYAQADKSFLEPLFTGGSEIYVEMPDAYLNALAKSSGKLVDFSLIKHTFTIPRYYLRNKKFYRVNCIMKSNWSTSELKLAQLWYEKDYGKILDYELAAEVQTKKEMKVASFIISRGTKFTGKIKGTITNHNDFIDLSTYQRSDYISLILHGMDEGDYKGQNIIRVGGSNLRITVKVVAYKLSEHEI